MAPIGYNKDMPGFKTTNQPSSDVELLDVYQDALTH